MRIPFCAPALVVLALLAAGCKKGPSLVGKWNGTIASPTGASGEATYEFKPDNAFAQVVKQGPATMTITGDYKLEGDDLTINLKDVKTEGVPPQFAGIAKNLFKGMMAKPMKAKVEFASDDEVSLSTPAPATAPSGRSDKAEGSSGTSGGPASTASTTLKRVKEGS